jgi:hypothetical protein
LITMKKCMSTTYKNELLEDSSKMLHRAMLNICN